MKVACCWMYAIGKYGYPPSLENMFKAIEEVAELGFDYFELEGLGNDNLQEVIKNAPEIKNRCSYYNMKISNFAVLLPDIISMDKKIQEEAFEMFKKGVETAAYLDSAYIWIDSYSPPIEILSGKILDDLSFGKQIKVCIPDDFSWSSFWNHFVESIGRCTNIVKSYDMQLLIEPRVGEVTTNSEALIRLGEAVDDDYFGVILDTAHQHAQKELLPLSVHKLGKLLKYVHVADNDGCENRHYQIGNGNIDWDSVFRSLKQTNYNGFFAIDLEKMPDLGEKFVQEKKVLEQYAERYKI